MKRGLLISTVLVLIFSMLFVSSEACNLGISLINQDPYPAIPGDYVKLVFQIEGVSNPQCGKIEFELLEQYPLVFDPNFNSIVTADSGIYHRDYNSFLIAPYKVRIDESALEGDTPIEVQYKYGTNTAYLTKEFNINIEDTRADFEIYVKDYNPTTKEITFEILNIAEVDIEALTLEIPKQDNIEVKGSKINIVGDLDSNEYTTASFEAVPKEGEINLLVSYTDSINERRTLEKNVLFEPEYFQDRNGDQKSISIWFYLFWILVIALVIYYFYKRAKKKRKIREAHHLHHSVHK